tara:strand:+ start:372 stop:935 length:564 start_codon:yes stop_codon:yes gene_type:complete
LEEKHKMLAKKIVAWMLLRVVNTMTVKGTSKKNLPPQSLADFERGSGGLLFKDEVIGSGRSPDEGDEIEVHYKGWFFAPQSTEGIQFDDSRAEDPTRGLIFEFGKAKIISGWKLGLETMKEGGKRTIILSPRLGYGKQKVFAEERLSIPGNSELVFDLELKRVDKNPFRKFLRNFVSFLRPNGYDYI